MTLLLKIATAAMSREIFLAFGNAELSTSFSRFAADAPPQSPLAPAPPEGEPSIRGKAAGPQLSNMLL